MKRYSLIHVAILVAAGLVNLAIPAQGADQQPLSAAKQEQVRSIGKALLAAKRTAPKDEEMVALKKDVQDAHALVRELILPVDGRLRLEKVEEAQGMSFFGIFKTEDEWTKARSGEIQQLRRVLTKLEDRGRQMTAQSLQTMETKRPLSPLAANAVSKLGVLRKELDTALSQPADERQEHLQRLADGLDLHSQSEIIMEQPRTDSPGMLTSTSHRPLNAN